MDFRHLIVTCLFSKLRLPFDNQKVKENYAIFLFKIDYKISREVPNLFRIIQCTWAKLSCFKSKVKRLLPMRLSHAISMGTKCHRSSNE